MGTWGLTLFSDDFAADVQSDYKELIGNGCSPAQATDVLVQQYKDVVRDESESSVFWLALAVTQWKTGHVKESVIEKVISVIDTGAELKRWHDDGSLLKQRRRHLLRLKAQRLSAPPSPKRLPKVVKFESDWDVGELVSYQLESGDYVLFRVIGHHSDRGGRCSVCELLDWQGKILPLEEAIVTIPIRVEMTQRRISQIMLCLPHGRKAMLENFRRIGIKTTPYQALGEYACFHWKYLNKMLKQIFAVS